MTEWHVQLRLVRLLQSHSATSRPMQNYHLTPISGRWKLSFDRSDVIFAGFDSRQEALEFCSELTRTKSVCLSIHRPDGTVMEKRHFFPHQASARQAA